VTCYFCSLVNFTATKLGNSRLNAITLTKHLEAVRFISLFGRSVWNNLLSKLRICDYLLTAFCFNSSLPDVVAEHFTHHWSLVQAYTELHGIATVS